MYASYVFFSSAAPGEPVFRTPPETWTWILNDSINFFYVNIFAKFIGLPSISTPDVSFCRCKESARNFPLLNRRQDLTDDHIEASAVMPEYPLQFLKMPEARLSLDCICLIRYSSLESAPLSSGMYTRLGGYVMFRRYYALAACIAGSACLRGIVQLCERVESHVLAPHAV